MVVNSLGKTEFLDLEMTVIGVVCDCDSERREEEISNAEFEERRERNNARFASDFVLSGIFHLLREASFQNDWEESFQSISLFHSTNDIAHSFDALTLLVW